MTGKGFLKFLTWLLINLKGRLKSVVWFILALPFMIIKALGMVDIGKVIIADSELDSLLTDNLTEIQIEVYREVVKKKINKILKKAFADLYE